MRTRSILLTLAIGTAAALVACGGSAPGATTSPGGGGGAGGATQGAPAPAGGEVDCAALEAAGAKLVAIQLLAQLTTPETVATLRDQALGEDGMDEFLEALATLHALDGYNTPLGDAKVAIDKYEAAARAARELFATEPLTQAAIDAFNEEHVGTIGEFLGPQAAISAAMGEAGC